MVTAKDSIELTEYKDFKLERGLWQDPHTRIFSLVGDERVAEISNYPRVYLNPDAGCYEEDTPFVVSKDDINSVDKDGEEAYYDAVEGKYFYLGQNAIHHAGEPRTVTAPPKWIPYKALQPVDQLTKMPTEKIPGKEKNKIVPFSSDAEKLTVAPAIEHEIRYIHYTRILAK